MSDLSQQMVAFEVEDKKPLDLRSNTLRPDGMQEYDPTKHTILSASYSNAENDAMTLVTKESGAVSICEQDHPALWAKAMSMKVLDYPKKDK